MKLGKITIAILFSAVILLGDFGFASAVVMSSTNYQIQIDSVNVGGGRGTSASYILEDTKGEQGTGILSGSNNSLYAGFQLPNEAAAVTPTPSPTPTAAGGGAGTRRVSGTFPNVENFTATPGDTQIQLTWINPNVFDFAGVRVMRSETFYPANPTEGVLIYNGTGQQVVDTNVTNGQPYYYTAFAYDQFGGFSSGAVAFAVPFEPGIVQPTPPTQPEIPTAPPDLVPESLQQLSFLDFDFIQNGKKLPVIGGKVEAETGSPLTIAIDYDKLPEVLKTILVTMKDDQGKVFSFLLRVDEDKQRYVATIHPPTAGLYPVSFVVVDYQNQGLKKVEGELAIKQALAAAVSPPGQKWWNLFWPELPIFLVIALLLFAIVKYMHRKFTENTDKEFQARGVNLK